MLPHAGAARLPVYLAAMCSVLAVIVVVLAAAAPAAAQSSGAPDLVVAEVRRATARYLDIENARADGYVQASGMESRHGYHWVQPAAQARALATGTLDLARPPVLLYVERDGIWQLAGVEYALPSAPSEGPLPASAWHRHEASCHYRDFREVAAASARDCPARHPASNEIFVGWHPTLATAHVWAWYPNPDGPFAESNPFLAPYGGFTAPDHHDRNPAELVYSQFTHRIAGGILLVLAALTTWESWRARPFPWNAVSAPVWAAFGAYLIPSSDPESWPYGPQRFVEIFDDPLVLQHKLLALVPIAIGVIVVLRGLGRYYVIRGEFSTAREVGDRLLAIAQARSDTTLLIMAHNALGIVSLYSGEFETALAHLETGFAMFDRSRTTPCRPRCTGWFPRGSRARSTPGGRCGCWATRTRRSSAPIRR